MTNYTKPLERLISQLNRLPGIGRKSAERLALYMVSAPEDEVRGLAYSISRLKEEVRTCSRCFNLAESDPCPICADPARDGSLLCVVETPADLSAMEKSGSFKGRYHVLSGALAPLDGVGPGALKVRELAERVQRERIREVIIATNPTVEGEATADLVARSLEGADAHITRLGYGMPVGGDLKYMDGLTLKRSLESRKRL